MDLQGELRGVANLCGQVQRRYLRQVVRRILRRFFESFWLYRRGHIHRCLSPRTVMVGTVFETGDTSWPALLEGGFAASAMWASVTCR